MASVQYDALLIRHRKDGLDTTYVLVDAVKLDTVAGPFVTLEDAVQTAARFIGPNGSLWQETADLRARPVDVHSLRSLAGLG